MAALLVLLLLMLGLDRLLLATLLLEARVIAGPQRELGMAEVQDVVAHRIEHIAIVRDDDDRRGIPLQVVDQPERALEVEVVGGLVEQQQVRLGEQHGGECHPHTPAA